MSFAARLSKSRSPAGAGTPARRGTGRARISGDSPLWLILVAAAFVLAELAPPMLRLPLGTDEITYLAQTSVHASQVILPPVHTRGVGLLAAPVTLLTTSLLVLRVWMALLSGLGLLAGLLAWRGLRPAWVLAVAGAILGSLGIAQLSGVQVMPDWWQALCALALTGLFLQAVTGRMRAAVVLPLLAATTCLLFLLRPQSMAFVLAPVIAAALIVPGWRNARVLAAIGCGLAAGIVEWLAEAQAWYGGPVSRLHMMAQEPPKFGLYFSLQYQLRVLNGPWYCRPGTCQGWHYPWLTVWWLALLALIILGILAVRRTALASSVFAVACGLSVIAGYTFFVPYAAPRYLLPALALLAIPAADGIAWLATAPTWRAAGIVLACAFLVAGAVTQNVVGRNEAAAQHTAREIKITEASQLRRLGIRPPCVVESNAVAYFVGCAAPWTGEHVHEVLARAPGGLRAWRRVHFPGAVVAYVRDLPHGR